MQYKLTSPDAKPPVRQNEGDVGYDLTAASVVKDEGAALWFDTGIAVAIPEGHEGVIRPRSSITKYDLMLHNAPGTIDRGYTGSIQVRFRRLPLAPVEYGLPEWYGNSAFAALAQSNPERREYEVGDRIAQLIISPVSTPELQEVERLSKTQRGEGGFGSTG